MRTARYTVTVYVDVCMDDDVEVMEYTCRKTQRTLERDVIAVLEKSKSIGENIDAECMEVEVVTT